MTRNPDDWTPAVGWRDVAVHMLIRGVVSGVLMTGAIAAMAAWFRSSEGTLPTPVIRGTILFIVGLIIAAIMSVRLVTSTGIVSKALMLVILVVLGIGAFVGRLVIDQSSLAMYYGPILFMYPVGVAWAASSVMLLRDF